MPGYIYHLSMSEFDHKFHFKPKSVGFLIRNSFAPEALLTIQAESGGTWFQLECHPMKKGQMLVTIISLMYIISTAPFAFNSFIDSLLLKDNEKLVNSCVILLFLICMEFFIASFSYFAFRLETHLFIRKFRAQIVSIIRAVTDN